MMRDFVAAAAAVLLLLSCESKKEDNQAEIAGNAARQYYSYLMAGDCGAFVDGTCRKDSIRKEFRDQLIDNARMFVAQQQDEHKGIKAVEVKRVDIDTMRTRAEVFLVLTYGDKTNEQVLVPMVKSDGLWYMK